jgi:hypothetical protein
MVKIGNPAIQVNPPLNIFFNTFCRCYEIQQISSFRCKHFSNLSHLCILFYAMLSSRWTDKILHTHAEKSDEFLQFFIRKKVFLCVLLSCWRSGDLNEYSCSQRWKTFTGNNFVVVEWLKLYFHPLQ